jgi:FdhE protein
VNPPPHLRRRLERLWREVPEWRSWLDLLAATAAAVSDPAWDRVETQLGPGRAETSPILTGAEIALDRALAQRWVRHLLVTAARGGGAARSLEGAATRVDPLEFLGAAVSQDSATVASLGGAAGAVADALIALVGLAAMPLLQACGRRFGSRVPAGWMRGYCPMCGSWPAFGEIRGIERSLWLRCARCGSDWRWQWRCCVYCGESGYARLGCLVSERTAETRKVDTCASCLGYLKTVTVLQSTPPDTVALEDLGTVDLDLAALERGYCRAPGPGCVLGARLVPARSRSAGAGRWGPFLRRRR